MCINPASRIQTLSFAARERNQVSKQFTCLQHNRVDDICILDGKIQRHAPGGGDGVALDLVPGDASELIPVIRNDYGHQRDDPGSERVPSKHQVVLGPMLDAELLQRPGLAVEKPSGRLEEAVVDEATVEHLAAKAVVQEDLVVALADEVEAADGEDDLLVVVVNVDEVGGAAAQGLVVVDELGDPGLVHAVAAGGCESGLGEVVLVDGEDRTAHAGHRLELVGSGRRPRLAVVGAHVGQPLPRPSGAAHANHALYPARHRHAGENY